MDVNRFQIYCSLAGRHYPVHQMQGFEALSTAYRFLVTCLIPKNITVTTDQAGLVWQTQYHHPRYCHAWILSVSIGREYDEKYCLTTFELVPKFQQLASQYTSKLWQNISTQVVIQHCCADYGYQTDHIRFICKDTIYSNLIQFQELSTWEFLQSLTQKNKLYFWVSADEKHEYINFNDNFLQQPDPNGDNKSLERALYDREYHYAIHGSRFVAKSNLSHLYPGLHLQIGAEHYIIKEIQHFYLRASNKQARHYYNQIVCIPIESSLAITEKRFQVGYQIGYVAENDNPWLDELGRYQIRHQQLTNVYKRYPYYYACRPDTKWQTSLSPGSQVLLGHVDNDSVILGCFFPQQGLVTQNNLSDGLLQTSQHYLCLSRQQLALACQNDTIHFNQNITLSTQSRLSFHQRKLDLNIRGHSHEVAQDKKIQAKQYQQKSCLSGLQYRSNTIVSQQQTVSIQSNAVRIMAQKVKYQGQQFNLQINGSVQAKRLAIQVKGLIQIHADRIMLGNQQAGLLLDQSGELVLWGKKIIFESSQLQINAKIQTGTLPQVSHFNFTLKMPSRLSKTADYHHFVRDLSWSRSVVPMHERARIKFRLLKNTGQLGVKIYLCQAKQNVIPYHSQQLDKDIETRRHLETIMLAEAQIEYSLRWRLKQTIQLTAYALTYFRFAVVCDGIESFQLSPPLQLSDIVKVDMQEKIWLSTSTPLIIYYKTLSLGVLNRVTIVERQIRCQAKQGPYETVLVLGTICRLHLEHHELLNVIPNWYKEEILHYRKNEISIINCCPPIIVNARMANRRLMPAEIDYFLKYQQTATIFVHGYNVSLGKFDNYHFDAEPGQWQCADKVSLKNGKLKALVPATFYRQATDEADNVNGSGAHHWLIQMEHYVNKALGHSAQQFKRIILFSWPGDTHYQWDFIGAMEAASQSAYELIQLIQQLHTQGIQVNLIAHSLGAGVVIKAMQGLAERGLEHCCQDVILWQAAIPNNSLLPQPDQDRWRCHLAHRVAKHITILYSEHDNILGPRSKHDGLNDSKKPFAERVYPRILQQLNLSSLYELSVWLGLQPQTLMTPDNRDKFYQQWIQVHPYDKSGLLFPESLSLAVKRYTASQAVSSGLSQIIAAEKQFKQLLLKYYVADKRALFKAAILEKKRQKVMVQSFNQEIQTLFSVIKASGYHPCPALGWSGPDLTTRRLLAEKLILIDQRDILFHHSAMLEPTKRVYEKIFRGVLAQRLNL